MAGKEDLKRVYLDTSVILPWFQNIMQNKKDKYGSIETPEIIKFLIGHPEIEKFISSFTVAELVEELLFRTSKVKLHMRKLQLVEESKNGEKGLLIPVPELLEYTALIGYVKDAIHVCVAKHEDIYIVTKDDKVGKVQQVYPKTIGMKGFAKAFE